VGDARTRHGRPLAALGARLRALRRATAPLRARLRRLRPQRAIQRTAALASEDRAPRRKRWHVLVDLLNRRVPGAALVVVEVGSRDGRTAAHLLRYCPRIAALHAVDRAAPDPARDRLRGLPRARFVHGDSAGSAAGFADGSVDLVFVDADHAEAAVARDLAAWAPKLRPGGILCGHDYGARRHPGVARAVDRFARERGCRVRVEADRVWWTAFPPAARGADPRDGDRA